MKTLSVALAALVICALSCGPSTAATKWLEATNYVTIRTDPVANGGVVGSQLQVEDIARGYLRFDLSSVPDQAVVTSATLGLRSISTSSQPQVIVYRSERDNWSDLDGYRWLNPPQTDMPVSSAVTFGHDSVPYYAWSLDLSNWNVATDLADNVLTLSLNIARPGSGILFAGYGGNLQLEYEDAAIPEPAAGIPEPATWALMISGFGLAGAALRRRRMIRA